MLFLLSFCRIKMLDVWVDCWLQKYSSCFIRIYSHSRCDFRELLLKKTPQTLKCAALGSNALQKMLFLLSFFLVSSQNIKTNLKQCLFTLTPPTNVWLDESTLQNSAHHRVIGRVNITKLRPPTCDWTSQHYKTLLTVVIPSCADGKVCVVLILTRSTRVRIRLLVNFFLPF